MHRKRYIKYTPSKLLAEAKKHGVKYIRQKYGEAVYAKMADRLKTIKSKHKARTPSSGGPNMHHYDSNRTTSTPNGNTSAAPNSSYKSRAKRPDAYAKNAPPKAHGLFKAQAGRMKDGGPSDPATQFKRQMNFNLSNDEDVAQGSETQWSTPTSISHLISGQLRQAANSGVDYWDAWAQDKDGTTSLSNRSGSPFGVDASFSVGPSSQLAASNPMGAFGTSAVMNDYGQQEFMEMEEAEAYDWRSGIAHPNALKGFDTWAKANGGPDGYYLQFDPDGTITNGPSDGNYGEGIFGTGSGTPDSKGIYRIMSGTPTAPAGSTPRSPSDGTGTSGPVTLPNIPVGSQPPTDNDVFGTASGQVYNPWSRMEGGSTNSMGPNSQTLAQGTMEAMNLANAYFAPQRAELAYELGDMETDMRRMAVNLGRQVDDPILQAKLYKEAARSVRTMDIQQNTLAFQMADQRRKEDIANWQFYDQLAAQEAQLKLANRQFYDKFDLDKRYYNLENWNAANNAGGTVTKAPAQQQEQSYGNLVNGYKTY